MRSAAAAVASFSALAVGGVLRHLARHGRSSTGGTKVKEKNVVFKGRVCWICGPPCSGKSFLGDFLAKYYGFKHIDGDAVSYSTDPADVEAWAGMLQAFQIWFRGEAAPTSLWENHYESICKEAALAASEGHRVGESTSLLKLVFR